MSAAKKVLRDVVLHVRGRRGGGLVRNSRDLKLSSSASKSSNADALANSPGELLNGGQDDDHDRDERRREQMLATLARVHAMLQVSPTLERGTRVVDYAEGCRSSA